MAACPNCNDPNAYNGLFGWSCTNHYCTFYVPPTNPESLSSSNIENAPKQFTLFSAYDISEININHDFSNNKSKDVIEEEQFAIQILHIFCNEFKYCLIAGGAPRNWTYNRTCRDIDIYVALEEPEDLDKLKNIKNYFSNVKEKIDVRERSGYSGMFLESIYDFSYKHKECQAIFINNYDDTLSNELEFAERIFCTYDFGICKAAMNKMGVYYTHKDFICDYKNQTISLNASELYRNNKKGMEKLVERSNKMRTYFPDHHLILV